MIEQPTGDPGRNDEPPAGQRAVLVVAPLRALEGILLCLGMWEDDDPRDPSAGTERRA